MIKPIPGFYGYFVSSEGDIYTSLQHRAAGQGKNFKSWYEVDDNKKKKLKPIMTTGGYLS